MERCEWCGKQTDSDTDYCDRVCLSHGGGEVIDFSGEEES